MREVREESCAGKRFLWRVSGVYAARISKWFLLLPIAAIFLSDLVIGFYDWKMMAAVYASFGVIGLMLDAVASVIAQLPAPNTTPT